MIRSLAASRHGDEVVGVHQEPAEQLRVPSVTDDQPVGRVAFVRAADRAVFRLVVQADHFVAPSQELFDHIAANET